jgi:hypothetical protein
LGWYWEDDDTMEDDRRKGDNQLGGSCSTVLRSLVGFSDQQLITLQSSQGLIFLKRNKCSSFRLGTCRKEDMKLTLSAEGSHCSTVSFLW